jgi:hypothetical protein
MSSDGTFDAECVFVAVRRQRGVSGPEGPQWAAALLSPLVHGGVVRALFTS